MMINSLSDRFMLCTRLTEWRECIKTTFVCMGEICRHGSHSATRFGWGEVAWCRHGNGGHRCNPCLSYETDGWGYCARMQERSNRPWFNPFVCRVDDIWKPIRIASNVAMSIGRTWFSRGLVSHTHTNTNVFSYKFNRPRCILHDTHIHG